MIGARAEDALRRGMGRAAASVGAWCDAYRPGGIGPALAAENRFLRLQAAFGPPSERWRAVAHGGLLWWGTFDAAYTLAGDFLVRAESRPGAADGGVWFIAAQEPLLPVLCVRATRVLDISRPAGAAQSGVNGYGGVTIAAATPLLSQYPAGVLGAGSASTDDGGLPSDVPAGSWQVLLPAVDGLVLRNGDVLADDLGRTAIVASAELTALGWRLAARQATT